MVTNIKSGGIIYKYTGYEENLFVGLFLFSLGYLYSSGD